MEEEGNKRRQKGLEIYLGLCNGEGVEVNNNIFNNKHSFTISCIPDTAFRTGDIK